MATSKRCLPDEWVVPAITPENFPHFDDMKKACRTAVKDPTMVKVSPDYIVYCWCVLRDGAKAKELAAKLPADRLQKLVSPCKELFGIDLQ